MDPFVIIVIAVLVVLVAIGLVLLLSYRGLARLSKAVDVSWSDVQTKFSHRSDLLAAFSGAISGALLNGSDGAASEKYAASSGFVADAVKAGKVVTGPEDGSGAESMVHGAFTQLTRIVQETPSLRGNDVLQVSQQSISAANEKIKAARRVYNGGVRELQARAKRFPASMFAKSMAVADRVFFDETNRNVVADAPRVKF